MEDNQTNGNAPYQTTIVVFDKSAAKIKQNVDFSQIHNEVDNNMCNWIHITNFNKTLSLEKLAEVYNIHPLITEDASSFADLPKIEEYENNLFFSIKLLHYNSDADELSSENFGFILGNKYLFCFQERDTAIFNNIRQRIQSDIGRVRKKEIDYLFYLLIDAIVDSYYALLQKYQIKVDELEDLLVDYPDKNYMQEIHHYKKQLSNIRRLIFPLSEAINKLTNADSVLISDDNDIYFNDVMEHVKHLASILESLRDTVASLIELNMSNMNNRMNSVMKTLTVVSAIFIPLTFLAGVYGMNFENLPETRWKYGYFMLWGFMILISAAMIIYMKRKKWF